MGDKKKRSTTHAYSEPTYGYVGELVTLPDGREGVLVDRGWLDADGAFYAVPEGQIGKIVRVQGTKIVYAPLDDLEEMGICLEKR
jgi:hypothetical protein